MAWDYSHIVELAAGGLESEARRLALEQSVRGIDALNEVLLHPLLRAGIATGPYLVLAEERYPPSRSRKRRSEGERCDIVVIDTRDVPEAHHLVDPLAAGTLFGSRGADPEQALWIEAKVVHQWMLFDGGIRANPAYSSLLLREATSDVRKLSKEPGIVAAAVLIVMFTDTAATADHDLGEWHKRCVLMGLPVSSPFLKRFVVTDRLGNGCCSVALAPVHHA